jgi:hypothetical protein
VVLSAEAPGLSELPSDLAGYPEITAALVSGEIVAVEDVGRSTTLRPVGNLLPNHFGCGGGDSAGGRATLSRRRCGAVGAAAEHRI